ncbi:MAG: hypothetical protein EOM20_17940 [Spartobacteria bacterium]|nr:hypothetical protein [Spartobacteria bacterium]
MKRWTMIWMMLALLSQTGLAQLTAEDTKDAAARVTKEAPKAVREGLGWGTFRLGATTDELLEAIGPPDEIQGHVWSWANTHNYSCLVNEQDVAWQLNFFGDFNYPLASGIRIGSPGLKALGRYGVPDNVEDSGGMKIYYYPQKGVIINVSGKTVAGFSIIERNVTDLNPLKPVYVPGEEIIETNVVAVEEGIE